MIVFYGSPASSSGKTHWMLEELAPEVAYEYRRVDRRDPEALSQFRQVCPAGRVPFIIDGEGPGQVRMLESMAINFYLAERYRPQLAPASLEERAQALQWSFWAITNLQPEAMTVMMQSFVPEAARNPEAAHRAHVLCDGLLAELEAALESAGGEYLLGQRFTVADVNVGSVVNIAVRSGVAGGPRTQAWMEALRARPAYQRAAQAAR